MPANFTIKIRNGQAEFEEKSIQKLAKALLKELKPLLKRPKPEKAQRIKAKNGRRGKKPKASYPAEAIKPLKAFLKKAKPKKKLDLALSIAKQHMQHFEVRSFTNKDLTNAATAIGKKLGNVSALLKNALITERIKKLGKGTWQLVEGKTGSKLKAGRPRKSRKTKVKAKQAITRKPAQPKAKPIIKPKAKKPATKPKLRAFPKPKPAPKPQPKKEPASPPEPPTAPEA